MKITKISKFWNFSSIRYFAPFAIWPIFILIFDINFIFYYSDSRKFGRSTFERSLIFKFEISAILKFYSSKFWPSPEYSKLALNSQISQFMEKYLKNRDFFHIEKKKFPTEKLKTFLNMPIRGEIPKNSSLRQFWTPKTAKSYEINQNRYFCTDFIELKVKKFLWKKNLEIVAKFGNLPSGLKRRLMWQFVEKYKKIQVCQICKFSKFAK